jgi:hypothetical protein
VRLVDGDEREAARPARQLLEQVDAVALQRFGRRVDQVELAAQRALQVAGVLLRGRADDHRGDAALAQRLDLVLHQRDERRHHHARRLGDERQQLVAHGLAAARRKHDERVLLAHGRLDHGALPWPQRRVAPVMLELLHARALPRRLALHQRRDGVVVERREGSVEVWVVLHAARRSCAQRRSRSTSSRLSFCTTRNG